MPSLGLLLGGAGIIAAVAGWGFYERSEAIKYEASAATLRAANDANLATISRMESDIIINEARAIADALERRELEGDVRDLQTAVDGVAATDCPDPAMAALLEQRRLQLQRDRDRNKTGRP